MLVNAKNSYATSSLDNKSVDEPKGIANIFNNFLANVGKTSYRKGNAPRE